MKEGTVIKRRNSCQARCHCLPCVNVSKRHNKSSKKPEFNVRSMSNVAFSGVTLVNKSIQVSGV